MFGLRAVRVRGRSMEPTLIEGDLALGRGPSLSRSPAPGNVVLVRLPNVGLAIKRIHRCDIQGLHLRGDGPLSTPTVDLPILQPDDVVAVLRWRLRGARLSRLSAAPGP